MTQTEQVLEGLRKRGEEGLTPQDALRWYGCMRLAARIADLKPMLRPDEEIVNEGKTYARYVLRRKADQQTGLGW